MMTQEFVAAEVAYRIERLSQHRPGVRRQRTLREVLHLGQARR